MKSLSALYLLLCSFLQFSEKPFKEASPTETNTEAYGLQLSLHVIECKRRQAEAICGVHEITGKSEILNEWA